MTEIERLEQKNRSLWVECIRAKSIKEFAERLKSYLHQDDFETPDERWKPESDFALLIDIVVKEMEGED